MVTETEGILPWLTKAFVKELDRRLYVSQVSNPARRGHYEPDEELLAKFKDFEKRYEAILAEGWETGFLIGGYEPDQLFEPRGTWIWDETEEEFEQRKKREACDLGSGGHAVFPVAKGPRL